MSNVTLHTVILSTNSQFGSETLHLSAEVEEAFNLTQQTTPIGWQDNPRMGGMLGRYLQQKGR